MANIMTATKTQTNKKWLYASLAAAVLSLSACADKDAALTEDDPMVDAQTPVEQAATGVASADTANDPLVNDDVAVASANDDMAMDNDFDPMNDDVAVATADDYDVDESEILDGTESEEHISTY